MIATLAFASWLFTGVGIPPTPVPAIPPRFLGEWNVDPDHCGTGIGHDGLTIETNRIGFYESGGTVRAVVFDGERELALIASMSGEGMDWLGLLHFRLSPDHARLVDLAAHGGPVVRHRCPPPSTPSAGLRPENEEG
ncbi:MAG TPA: hypothetical protein VFM73_07735 [Xanthomonadaceae bacterium]|nr:hypothetical protein [Xanthomonadaceae bacterium]